MTRKLKKVLALLLTLSMVMSMVTVTSFAAGGFDWSTNDIRGLTVRLHRSYDATDPKDVTVQVNIHDGNDTVTYSYSVSGVPSVNLKVDCKPNSDIYKVRSIEVDGGYESSNIITLTKDNAIITFNVAMTCSHSSYGNWASDGTDTHTRQCSNCIHTETEDHSFSIANCTTPATCAACGQTQGEVDMANHIGTIEDGWLKDAEGHWQTYSDCHHATEKADHTFTYTDWSNWTDCTDDERAGQQEQSRVGICSTCIFEKTETQYQGKPTTPDPDPEPSRPNVTQFQLTVKCINEERGHGTFNDTASGGTIEAVESISYSLRAEDCTLAKNQDGTYTLTANVEWYLGQFNGRATYMHRSPVETVSATLAKVDGAWTMDSALEVGVICIPVTDTHNPDTWLGVRVRCVEEENHSLLWQEVGRSAYTLTGSSVGINGGTDTYPAERYPFCTTYTMTVEGQTDFVNRYYNGLLVFPDWKDRIGHEHKLVDGSTPKSVTYYWDMQENVWVRDGESYLTIEVCDSRISYLVTFNSNGGSEVESRTAKEGDKATRPADPTRSGYTFNGWYLGDTAYDFETPVTGDITLTAQWTENYVPPVTTYYNLTVNYVDTEGNTMAPAATRRLASGSSYSISSPAIEGYTADQTVVSGTLTRNLTVTVTYAADENVDDNQTPLTEAPETSEPAESTEPTGTQEPDETEAPEETEDLGETDTPLTETPEETEELGETDTPLADVPQTGDMLWLWILLAVGSASGLIWISLEEKKGRRAVK